jgi:hypothetical protein
MDRPKFQICRHPDCPIVKDMPTVVMKESEWIAALLDALKELGVDVIATIDRLEETIGRKPDADDMVDWHDSIRRGACWNDDAQYHDALYMWMLLTGNYQPPKEAEHE